MCKTLMGVGFINWKVAMFGMGACSKVGDRLLWLMMSVHRQ